MLQLYLVKMRSFWRRVRVSYNLTDVLKRKIWTQETHLLGGDGGRDWNDAPTSQVMPANTRSRREAWDRFSLGVPKKEVTS